MLPRFCVRSAALRRAAHALHRLPARERTSDGSDPIFDSSAVWE